MRYQYILLIKLVLLSLLFINCKHDMVVDLDLKIDSLNCEPGKVYFENHVLPILLNSCALSACHDKTSQKAGAIMTDYESLIKSKIIRVNNAEESKLFQSISENSKNRMPPDPYQALGKDQIEMVEKWINQGAVNNLCTACDTLNFKYNTNVSKIIADNCIACHSGSSPSAGIALQTYENVKSIADDNRLLGVINGTGYSLMPPSGKMDDCKIIVITKWVNSGANNN